MNLFQRKSKNLSLNVQGNAVSKQFYKSPTEEINFILQGRRTIMVKINLTTTIFKENQLVRT